MLDEPMNGLDNRGVQDIKDLLSNFRAKGKTILLASHHMVDISELCDTVCLMDEGKLKYISGGELPPLFCALIYDAILTLTINLGRLC